MTSGLQKHINERRTHSFYLGERALLSHVRSPHHSLYTLASRLPKRRSSGVGCIYQFLGDGATGLLVSTLNYLFGEEEEIPLKSRTMRTSFAMCNVAERASIDSVIPSDDAEKFQCLDLY